MTTLVGSIHAMNATQSVDCLVDKGYVDSVEGAKIKLIISSLPENERDLLQVLVALNINALP